MTDRDDELAAPWGSDARTPLLVLPAPYRHDRIEIARRRIMEDVERQRGTFVNRSTGWTIAVTAQSKRHLASGRITPEVCDAIALLAQSVAKMVYDSSGQDKHARPNVRAIHVFSLWLDSGDGPKRLRFYAREIEQPGRPEERTYQLYHGDRW